MAQTWPQYCPDNSTLNSIPLCALHDSSVKILAISGIGSIAIVEIAKAFPQYGQSMATMVPKLVLVVFLEIMSEKLPH